MEEEITSVVEDMTEMSKEEKAKAWEDWVRTGVNAALDAFLPRALAGHFNTAYTPVVREVLETGPQYDESKAKAVTLTLFFEFEEPLDLNKPIVEEEE